MVVIVSVVFVVVVVVVVVATGFVFEVSVPFALVSLWQFEKSDKEDNRIRLEKSIAFNFIKGFYYAVKIVGINELLK